MKIPLLYTTFNRLEYPKRTRPRLIEATPEADIYVVDNGSTDGTQAYLNGFGINDHFHIDLNSKNIGVANAMNWFFETIRLQSTYFVCTCDFAPCNCVAPIIEYVAKVDNDTMVSDGWLPKMIEAAKTGKIDVLQAKHHFIIPKYKDWNELEQDQGVENLNGCGKIVHFPFVGGSGIVIRRDAIKEDIKGVGHIFGWSVYQDTRPEIRSAFYSDVWIDLLDMQGYNQYMTDIDIKYYCDTGRLVRKEIDASGNIKSISKRSEYWE